MNETSSAKQQIVERIKNSTNILVTVSDSPSVDELSAALGLTLLLNKLDKHATAVVSGAIPPAITFLDPSKTFENTVDSLRDFIIALDKEKADHLRYKVDGDVVKIFITPYRTTITSDDLDFSQGDYNVELVLALGVKKRENLDGALAAHGRILHDATVATIGIGDGKSDLGSIDWTDAEASSLSEMLVGLIESLKADKPLLDEQIATALLTGIVSSTDRFSASNTSSRTMTMAAQLMAAGANQQLIALKLDEEQATQQAPVASNTDGTTDLSEGKSTKLDKKASKPKTPPKKKDDGSLTISHQLKGDVDEVAEAVAIKQQDDAAKAAEEALSQQLQETAPPAAPVSVPAPEPIDEVPPVPEPASQVDVPEPAVVETPSPLQGAVDPDAWLQAAPAPTTQLEPQLGGTLNATAEQAADESRRELESERNKTLLSHNDNAYLGGEPTFQAPPINSANGQEETEPTVDMFGEGDSQTPTLPDPQVAAPAAAATPSDPMSFEPMAMPAPAPETQTLADLDALNRGVDPTHADDARAAIDQAFAQAPGAQSQPAAAPSALPPLPPMPDFSTLPPLPPVPSFDFSATPPATQPEVLGDILASDQPAAALPQAAPQQPPTSDPGQFKIPGQ